MDDLISREDALKALDEMSYKSPHESATSVVRKKHFGEILEKFIMQQPSAQQWIPCSERLPDNDFTDVLICVHDKRKGCEKDYYIISAYTSGRHWEPTLAVDMTDFDVIAWMRLPEPYKEEK